VAYLAHRPNKFTNKQLKQMLAELTKMRTREEIVKEYNVRLLKQPQFNTPLMLSAVLEVLCDIRDLLQEREKLNK
jgi:hypothetical protein